MAHDLEQATIMVIDDLPDNLRLLEGMLAENRYDVLTFPRGDLALEAASRNPPDLILLDISMPGMDGFELCERLKADEELKGIPVIFITAMTDTADKIRAFAVGGVDYVTKPFQLEEVRVRVETHLELRDQRVQLEEQYRQLRDLEQLRDGLVHMIVHDMNNVLTVILGNLSMVQRRFGDELAEDASRLVRLALGSGRELSSMVADLLDTSRMESGEMPVNAVECDIAALARDVVAEYEPLIQSMDIEPEIPEGSVLATCDDRLIRRVAANLIGNALDFSTRGGELKIQVEHVDGAVKFCVGDSGPGVPPEYHSKIFEKFGRVEGRAKGEKHSTGLGLAFCKLAVQAHGGHIGVDSEVGKGSTFWFTIPSIEPVAGA